MCIVFGLKRQEATAARPGQALAEAEARRRKEIVVPTQFVSSYRKRKKKSPREREKKAFNRLELFSGFDYFVVFCRFRENSSPRRIARFIVLKGEATNL
jgi:hypothetical protein